MCVGGGGRGRNRRTWKEISVRRVTWKVSKIVNRTHPIYAKIHCTTPTGQSAFIDWRNLGVERSSPLELELY